MKKDERIVVIKKTMKDFNKHAKTPFKDIEDIDKVPSRMITDAYLWIVVIRDRSFKEVLKVWALGTEDYWRRIELFHGFSDHVEVRMLRNARRAFNKDIQLKKRPKLFRRKHGKANSKTDDADHREAGSEDCHVDESH